MTEAEKARRLRASKNFREKRAELGDAQVALWIPGDLKERIDALVKAGVFKNRSEATAVALERFLEANAA